MLPEAERDWSVEEWAAALGEEEPEHPARDARREKERLREAGRGEEEEDEPGERNDDDEQEQGKAEL